MIVVAACCGSGREHASEYAAPADSRAAAAASPSVDATSDPSTDSNTEPSAASRAGLLVSLVNDARRSQGLAPLADDPGLDRLAQRQAERMARAGRVFHNASLEHEMFRAGWSEFGENVAVGPSIEDVHRGLLESAPHRTNILGDFTSVGVGVVGSRLGGYYVVEVFGKSASATPAGAEPFTSRASRGSR